MIFNWPLFHEIVIALLEASPYFKMSYSSGYGTCCAHTNCGLVPSIQLLSPLEVKAGCKARSKCWAQLGTDQKQIKQRNLLFSVYNSPLPISWFDRKEETEVHKKSCGTGFILRWALESGMSVRSIKSLLVSCWELWIPGIPLAHLSGLSAWGSQRSSKLIF